MPSSTAPPALGSLHRSGKEELRASILKTYLLRVRGERGDRVVRQLLARAGIDPNALDVETGWLSRNAAVRALQAIADLLGRDALRNRGEWTTHPEALGVHVRMLRSAATPGDAYRHLAQNGREVTHIGTWEIEEPVGPTRVDRARGRVRMIYRPRQEGDDTGTERTSAGEDLLCDARIGELSSLPRIWGLSDANIRHRTCVAKGGKTCVYDVEWRAGRPLNGIAIGAGAAAAVCGGLVALVGGPVAGGLAAGLGGTLGGAVGYLSNRTRENKAARTFEQHRIAALERGLDLRGDLGAAPGDLTGTVLGGKYRIARKIGSGGIGVVYSAEHVTLGHEVAVKVLRGAAARDGGEIARLRREAYIQVHVEHPNVARVLDLDQMPDGSIYVVMERLVGQSLADKLARDGLIAPGLAVRAFIDVCRGLGAAHRQGVIHRDLKPGNIFLCDDGVAKVLDFGMSKLASAESLTQTGYTLGTPEYMAPEQCIGAQVEPRTDLYALGVMMYEGLTGHLPIVAQNRRELLDLHQRQIPIPMRQRRPDLPISDGLDAAVMKCLKKRLNERPRSAAHLEQLLSAVLADELPEAYAPVAQLGRQVPTNEDETRAQMARSVESNPAPKR